MMWLVLFRIAPRLHLLSCLPPTKWENTPIITITYYPFLWQKYIFLILSNWNLHKFRFNSISSCLKNILWQITSTCYMMKSMVYHFSAYSAGCTICSIAQHIVQNTVLYSLDRAIQYCSAYCAGCNIDQQCRMQRNSVYNMGCSTIQHTVWVVILFSI